MTARAPSQAALMRAAKIVATEGVCIVIEANGTVYRIAPVGAESILNPTERNVGVTREK